MFVQIFKLESKMRITTLFPSIAIVYYLFSYSVEKWDIHPPSPRPSSAVPGYTTGTLFYIGQITRNKKEGIVSHK